MFAIQDKRGDCCCGVLCSVESSPASATNHQVTQEQRTSKEDYQNEVFIDSKRKVEPSGRAEWGNKSAQLSSRRKLSWMRVESGKALRGAFYALCR